MQKDKIFKTILLFCIPLLVLSCSKTAGDDSPGQDANLALALITRSENGDLAITGEDRFTSLATKRRFMRSPIMQAKALRQPDNR